MNNSSQLNQKNTGSANFAETNQSLTGGMPVIGQMDVHKEQQTSPEIASG